MTLSAKILSLGFILASAAPFGAAARESAFLDKGVAPMYWMAYEECFTTDRPLAEDRFKANIDWVAENFLGSGYDMVCTDGWIEQGQTVDRNGYVTKYNSEWEHDFAYWIDYCKRKGLSAGVYYDPLWMTSTAYRKNLPIAGSDKRTRDIKGDNDFNSFIYWVDTDKDGAEQWVKGYVRHFIELGFKFLRVDFLNMYENSYGTGRYRKALEWISQEAGDEIIVSIVMPNSYNWAQTERPNGDMFRISEDVFGGGFDFVSQRRRGVYQDGWANWGNLFDGFLHYSVIPRSEIMMDGDFIRLNTCVTKAEKQFWLSLLVMAGSPLAIADQYDTASPDDLEIYRNSEVLALVREGFHGKPLAHDHADRANSSVWWGRTASGDVVVALFNREDTPQIRTFDFSVCGAISCTGLRDLWTGIDMGKPGSRLKLSIEPHSCRLLRFTPLLEAAVSDVTVENAVMAEAFNIYGVPENIDALEAGIHIVRYSDGSIRKLIK